MVTLFLFLFGFVFMVTLKSVLHILVFLKSREESDSECLSHNVTG